MFWMHFGMDWHFFHLIRRSLKGAAFRTPQVIPVPPMPSQVIQKASSGAPPRARQAHGACAQAARIPAALQQWGHWQRM